MIMNKANADILQRDMDSLVIYEKEWQIYTGQNS